MSESTATSLDENTDNFCDNPTRDILAEGLIGLFKPTVDRLDERIQGTRSAQLLLSQQLDELMKQLKDIEEIQTNIPVLNDKVKKIINVKHKVTVISNILQNCQDRLVQLHRSVEVEHSKHKIVLDSLDQQLE